MKYKRIDDGTSTVEPESELEAAALIALASRPGANIRRGRNISWSKENGFVLDLSPEIQFGAPVKPILHLIDMVVFGPDSTAVVDIQYRGTGRSVMDIGL